MSNDLNDVVPIVCHGRRGRREAASTVEAWQMAGRGRGEAVARAASSDEILCGKACVANIVSRAPY